MLYFNLAESWKKKTHQNARSRKALSLMTLHQNKLLRNYTIFVQKTTWNKYA